MMHNIIRRSWAGRQALSAAAIMMFWASTAQAGAADSKVPTATQRLQARHPGLQARADAEGEITIFGRPMYLAETPEKAAAGFLAESADALGVTAPDLRIDWQVALGSGNATVFAYRQYVEGLPVEHAIARLLVYSGPRSAVVYASGRLVNIPVDALDRGETDGTAAVATVRSLPDYAGLVEWSTPQLVVYAGESDGVRRRPVRAWKFTAHTDQTFDFHAYTFFVSANTGRFIFARNEIYNAVPIFGRVTGLASPGIRPDVADNVPIHVALPELTVVSEFAAAVDTDRGGEYVLENAAPGPVEVTAELTGPWVNVRTSQGSPLQLTQTVTPPGPAVFVFNTAPSEFTTAQVNAFLHTVGTHNFFKDRQPAFTGIDRSITVNTNIAFTCNAFFTPVGLSINFFNAGDGCVNTAFSSVVAHEYGHFIVHQLSLAQGAFGEGFGDCVAILSYNDPIIGRDFFGPGTSVRDIVAADQQYPCSNENHVCGKVLAGIWWDLKLGMQSTLGAEDGLQAARQLFTDWSLITLGGKFRNGAHPGTAIEVLTADDNDGDLGNGTPHEQDICSAFAAHNIPCPGSCDAFGSIRASCRRGAITMSVSTDSPAGTPLTFVLDGGDSRTVTTNVFGRAVARWHAAAPGDHQVCIEDCDGSCRAVTCAP